VGFRETLESETDTYFASKYEISEGTVVPDVTDLAYGPRGRELDLAMLFIDIRESTKIVDSFRRTTAARMYKAFLNGVALIARRHGGVTPHHDVFPLVHRGVKRDDGPQGDRLSKQGIDSGCERVEQVSGGRRAHRTLELTARDGDAMSARLTPLDDAGGFQLGRS